MNFDPDFHIRAGSVRLEIVDICLSTGPEKIYFQLRSATDPEVKYTLILDRPSIVNTSVFREEE